MSIYNSLTNKELIKKAKDGMLRMDLLSEKQKNDKSLIKNLFKEINVPFKSIGEKLREDDVFMKDLLKEDSYYLVIASDRVKDDKEYILDNMEEFVGVFDYFSDRLKSDKDVVIKALKQGLNIYSSIGEIIKNDRGVVLEAVKNRGHSLDLVIDEYKNDKEIVGTACKNNMTSIIFASKELRDNNLFKEDVLKELGINIDLDNHQSCKEQVQKNKYIYCYLSDDFQLDNEILYTIISTKLKVFNYLSEENKKDIKVTENILLKIQKFNNISEQIDADVLCNIIKNINLEGSPKDYSVGLLKVDRCVEYVLNKIQEVLLKEDILKTNKISKKIKF